MHIPTAYPGKLLERGVYKLPAMGHNGEIILIAVTAAHVYVADSLTVIPWGSDLPAANDRLWVELDQRDPVSDTVRRRRIQVV